MAHSCLTLSVAGSRKTQGIVEQCAAAPVESRILVLTYTAANQRELRKRFSNCAGDHLQIEVMGWFSFLIRHFVKPFLPYKYDDVRVRGFDFKSSPMRGLSNESKEKYFNSSNEVRKVHLPQLAYLIEKACPGAPQKRLSCIYQKIYIDEVQDLGGYDLEILNLLILSGLEIEMVGDVRQAILLTNERERKNKPYKYMNVWNWYCKQERLGNIEIIQNNRSYRCRQEICDFADNLFDEKWGFEKTVSLNEKTTEHDGLFIVRLNDIPDYIDAYSPIMLRKSSSCGRGMPYGFINFGKAKGLSWERVMILPTTPILNYLLSGTELTDNQAANLYVAVTRAEQSVAFISDTLSQTSNIKVWKP